MATESLNKVSIIGKLVDKESTSGTNKNGQEYISGRFKVDTGADNIVQVEFYQNKLKKDGTSNSVYNGIMTALGFKSVADYTAEDADFLAISAGKVEENSYFSKDGKLLRGFRVTAPFFSQAKAGGKNEENSFVISGTVVAITPDLNEDTGVMRYLLDILVVGYGDRGSVLQLVVEGEKAIEYVKTNLDVRDEVKFSGKIVYVEKVEEKKEEVAFGSPIIETTTKIERKLLVTSMTNPQASTLSESEIETILAEREGRLKEAREKQASNQSTPKAAATTPASKRGTFSL